MSALFRRYAIHGIVGLSFLLAVSYAFYYNITPVVDAEAYDSIAQNLVAGFGFREDAEKSFFVDTAIVRAGPGYEFFLAGLYAIFGHHYEIVWVAQAMLHALSALWLFFICRRVFPERGGVVGFMSAFLFGLHPDLIEISAMLMTETLYVFFIILVVYCFVRVYQDSQQKFWPALLGIFMALAVLTRPPTALFIPIFLYFFWSRRHASGAAIFLFAFVVPLTPWVIRNFLVYRQFILTTLIGSYNIWVGNTLLSDGGQIAGGLNPATAFAEANGWFGFQTAATQAFFSFFVHHPVEFIQLCLVRAVRYFSLIRPMGFWFYQTGLQQAAFVASSAVVGVILFVGGYTGLARAIRERSELLRYLIALALTAPLPLLVTVVQSRYRFQMYPFLALFAGYAWVRIFQHKGWWHNRYWQFTALLLVALSIIDIVLHSRSIVERARLLL